jgi:hypothetical protein
MKTACAPSICLLFLLSWPATGVAQSDRSAPSSIPDHVIYGELFHRVAMFAKRTDAAQKQGKDRSNLRQLIRKHAGLDEEQGQLLEHIALQCERDVAAQDARAKALIDTFHAQFPYRIVNKGSPAGSPPSELRSLWEQRTNAILLGRERLHSALGDDAFAKFDQLQRSRAVREIRQVVPRDVGNVPGHRRHYAAQ